LDNTLIASNPFHEMEKGMTAFRKATRSKSKRFPRLIFVAALIGVLVIGGGTAYYLRRNHSTSANTQSSALQTATVTKGNIKLFSSGTGTLVAPAQATFGFSASGTVTEVLAQVGDVVEAGQLLAQLDDTSARFQYQQAEQALSELTSASSIASAELDIATYELAIADKRKALSFLISDDVFYWTLQVRQAEKDLQTAKDDAVAHPSADAEKKVQAAEQTLINNKDALSKATLDYWNDYVPAHFLVILHNQGFPPTAVKKIIPPTNEEVALAWADYDLANQQLKDAQDYLTALTTGTIPTGATGSKITALKRAQQTVETAKTALDATSLYAPIHGTITSLAFAVGDTAGSSSTVTIANLDQPYTLEIFLDQSDWSNIQVGYPVEVTFDLLPDTVYTGKVISIDPELSSANGSLYVHAYVTLDANVRTVLPFGTSASVDVIAGEATGVLLVPIEALHEISTGQYMVFVMVNGKPQVRSVEIGLMDATRAEVKSGLKEGDVVTTGITETK
jgi:multidrug efflux pump subunit AcrA (membrane-fusion protein)